MNKSCRWLALVMAVGLLVGTLAPVSALAYDKSDRPTDLIDPVGDPGPVLYGDPEPGSGGSPQRIDLTILKSAFWILLDSMHLRSPYIETASTASGALRSTSVLRVGGTGR